MNTTILSPKKIIKENILFYFLLFIGVILIYGNILNGQFLSADDVPGIAENPMVRDLEGSLKTYELERIYPAVMYKLFGMNPIPFHIASVLWHFVNIVLVYIFVVMVFGKTEAIIATLVFMFHPVNSETISWISAYGYTIYVALTLLILIEYALWHKTQDKKYLTIALVLYVSGLIFYRKPWTALIPVYVVLLDQLILEPKINFKKIRTYVLYAIPTLIYLFVYIKELYVFRTEALVTLYYNDPSTATPYFNRVLYTIFMTAKLLIWPINLTIYHEGERVPSISFFTIMSGAATMLIISLTVFLFVKSKGNDWKRHIAGLIVLIYSTMLLSFYPRVVVWSMADRYLYLATIFFGIILGILYTKVKNKKAFTYFFVLLLSFYAIRTIARTNDWKNSKNLWIATQKVSPYSYRVYNNLGDIYANEKNYTEAIKNFQTSVMLNPKFADAVHNLGFTYYQLGDKETAKTYLQKSYEMNPLLYQSLHKLGIIAYEQGDIALAKQYFEKALEINPNFGPAANSLRMLNSLRPSSAP